MITLLLFILPDCNVSKTLEERITNSISKTEFAGKFHVERYDMYYSSSRIKAKEYGINDAPTIVCKDNGNSIRGIKTEYDIRYWLRELLK